MKKMIKATKTNHEMKMDQRSFGYTHPCNVPWQCLISKEQSMDTYFDNVLNQPFSRKRFRRGGVFRFIGKVSDLVTFCAYRDMRCLDMPIKMPGSDYRLPAEFAPWSEAVAMAASFEHTHNKDVDNFYAYLTVDQKPVEAGASQRKSGLHVDGYQGARISPKVACDRSYIVVSSTPPIIHNQAFSVEHLDDSEVNVFHEFDRLAHESSAIIPKSFQMVFMDCYTVHGTRPMLQGGGRTFFRLSYSVRQYDRLGNSHNHLFDYKWEMVERSIHTALARDTR